MAEKAMNPDLTDEEAIDALRLDDLEGLSPALTEKRQGAERLLRSIAAGQPPSTREDLPVPADDAAPATKRRSQDWGATLELVQEACESIRISEERVALLENELEQVTSQYRNDLRTMSSRLSASQEEIKALNAKVKAADARAADAENWLAKINDAIRDGLGPYMDRSHDHVNYSEEHESDEL